MKKKILMSHLCKYSLRFVWSSSSSIIIIIRFAFLILMRARGFWRGRPSTKNGSLRHSLVTASASEYSTAGASRAKTQLGPHGGIKKIIIFMKSHHG